MKYKLTDETIKTNCGKTLYRIECTTHKLEGVGVRKGEKGGWIEKERNLSQSGTCWVYHSGQVFGENTVVKDAARVFNSALVRSGSTITDKVKVLDNSIITNSAINDSAVIADNANLTNCWVSGYARADGSVRAVDVKLDSYMSVRHGEIFEEPKYIGGLLWPVTITKTHIKIGCQSQTIESWETFDDYDISAMDEDRSQDCLDFWAKYKNIILEFAKL